MALESSFRVTLRSSCSNAVGFTFHYVSCPFYVPVMTHFSVGHHSHTAHFRLSSMSVESKPQPADITAQWIFLCVGITYISFGDMQQPMNVAWQPTGTRSIQTQLMFLWGSMNKSLIPPTVEHSKYKSYLPIGRSSCKGWVHLLLKLLMKVKCWDSGNYCTQWTWHRKQHLILPLYMCTPGRAESVWHLGSHGFPLWPFWREAWLGKDCHSLSQPPALGKYSGQAVANTLSSPWRGHDYCGWENVQPWWKAGERVGGGLVCQPKLELRGAQGFVLARVPKLSFWSFNSLWHASPFPQRSKRALCGHLTVRTKCCWWLR